MQGALIDLVAAHDELMPVFQSVPDESLGWRPGEDEFSIKHILVHLTHSNDFYLMIIEEARAMNFGVVRLHPELLGWQRMIMTDAEAWQCQSVALLHECFERAFHRLMMVLAGIPTEDLERPFVLYEIQPEAEPQTVNLSGRVLHMAASHLREHQSQLSNTLARWWSTQSAL